MEKKVHFFHSSIHFHKLKLSMVNNSDKIKVFCSNDFYVDGVPYFPMSAYEPKHLACLNIDYAPDEYSHCT